MTSIGGHAIQRDGRCSWCTWRTRGAPMPDRFPSPTGLDEAYRRHYDPDYGAGPYDV